MFKGTHVFKKNDFVEMINGFYNVMRIIDKT